MLGDHSQILGILFISYSRYVIILAITFFLHEKEPDLSKKKKRRKFACVLNENLTRQLHKKSAHNNWAIHLIYSIPQLYKYLLRDKFLTLLLTSGPTPLTSPRQLKNQLQDGCSSPQPPGVFSANYTDPRWPPHDTTKTKTQ